MLIDEISYKGGKEHLRRIMHDIGFSWKKTQSNRDVLMERSDVVAARINYLRSMKKYRDEERTIVYTDQTFVHSGHTTPRTWQSDDVALRVPFSKGERVVVVHAGSEEGFIQGAELVFKAHSASGDYHDEMNSINFLKWLNEKLIPNLPQRSVLVVDNAPLPQPSRRQMPNAVNTKG